MTWKSYAAASGATVLAGWLASTPPVGGVENRPAAPSRSSRAAASPSSDIVEQASRLQARIRRETAYVRPQRNPFQFEAARPAAETGGGIAEPAPSSDLSTPVIEVAPSVTLAGVAEDPLQDGVERTAILSSSAGVLLVRVGDEVLGQYRVAAVEAGAVDLLSLTDGSMLRLSLAR
jgi:hypothetical protein